MDEGSIRMAFDEYDRDASGRISGKELEQCLRKYGFNSQRARDIAKVRTLLCHLHLQNENVYLYTYILIYGIHVELCDL